MITNKDREAAVSMTRIWMRDNEGNQLEGLAGIIARIRAEYADQARKEAVDSETLSDIRRICEIILGNNFGNHELDSLAFYVGHNPAILNSTAQERKTDAEKLAIAVKALIALYGWTKAEVENFGATCPDDFIIDMVEDALKEIQELVLTKQKQRL